MTNISEIRNLVNFLDEGEAKYILLHVVSSYPLEERHSKLFQINDLKKNLIVPLTFRSYSWNFDTTIGRCSRRHTIEKHFTISPKYRLSDNFFSVTEDHKKMNQT